MPGWRAIARHVAVLVWLKDSFDEDCLTHPGRAFRPGRDARESCMRAAEHTADGVNHKVGIGDVRARLLADTAAHYGTMRFAMFTVFTAISGALIAFPFSDGAAAILAQPMHRSLLCVAGMVLSTFFALAEFRISKLVTFYQQEAYRQGALPMPDHHASWKPIVLVTMLLPYLFAFVFWVLLLDGTLVIPARSLS